MRIVKLIYASEEAMQIDLEKKVLEAFVNLGLGRCDVITMNDNEVFDAEIVFPSVIIHQFLPVEDIYQMWNKNGKTYFLNDKCWDFDANGILKLYKCVQQITSQPQFPPHTIQAHFTHIFPAGVIGAWKQPTGVQDAYQINDAVKHNSITWRSRRNANVFAPGTPSSGWLQISNLPASWYFLGNEGYPLDWEVTHNGNTWKNNNNNNTWEPGVFGWSII